MWSLHPGYLDSKGLVACWREALLAKAILSGRTLGYRHHPQLDRFREHPRPLAAIDQYLLGLYDEACRRGYVFDKNKIGHYKSVPLLTVTSGQLRFELDHLNRKLSKRDPLRYATLRTIRTPKPHPLFRTVAGRVEEWERES